MKKRANLKGVRLCHAGGKQHQHQQVVTQMTNELLEQRLKPTNQVEPVAWSDANLKKFVLLRRVVKLVCVVKRLGMCHGHS